MEEKDIKKAPQQGEQQDTINITEFVKNFNKEDELKLKIHTLKELDKISKKPKWLIESFFIRQGVGILHSLPGIGKTWWALKFCECIATGHIFANQYKVKKGKCLYIGAEDYKGIAERLKGIQEIIETDSNLSDSEIKDFKKNIQVLEIENGKLALDYTEKIKFKNEYYDIPTKAIKLYHTILDFKKHYDFIVIDTLARTLNDSVNNDLAGQNYMNAVEWLSKALNCFILLISHESKSAEFRNTTMGTIKFTASADIELGTYYYCGNNEKDKKELQAKIDKNEKPKLLKLFCTKPPKHGNEPEQVNMRIRIYYSNKRTDNFGNKITICRLDKDKSINYTMSQYLATQGQTYNDPDIEELKPIEKGEKMLRNVFGDKLID